ncbi:IS66 family insertion sequence element accessory protein TnpB [Bradyrhizobium erythrophlei]|uniref:IS66 family insertion sequence element accessory protein TnpB n=1 Tax=Bradyrhizobium erythrophlei TaxID=1437360 RepID=UPI0035EA8E9A
MRPHLAIARFACDTAWLDLIDGGATIANAMLDARQEGDSYRPVEVITGQRRRWTDEGKARIVAESFEEGANISEVARRNGVVRGLLTVWRHQIAAAGGQQGAELRADPNWCRERWWDSWRDRAYFVGTDEAVGDRCTGHQALRGNRDRDEWGAHPGRAGRGAGDAFDGAVGAPGHPVTALRSDLKMVLAAQPIDFRKSVHTLSALVSEALRANGYCGDVFVFRSKPMDGVKLLAWDGSGM